ncbi:MAG: SDR family oxidoreductase [Deltaproteobacteria bacterium]|nr:SDR family oxidoreductase [Deltaproteobacteria bacterium]
MSGSLFDLSGRVAVITGGAGFLGRRHAEAIAEAGSVPVLIDIDGDAVRAAASGLASRLGCRAEGVCADITNEADIEGVLNNVLGRFGRLDILVNNAANNPKMEAAGGQKQWSRLEHFPLDSWNLDLAVGLTGAFLCSRVFGAHMARERKGVVLNIASDLGVIAPDQRIYRKDGVPEEQQPVKPVTYSVVKHGLIGLTKYLATYWAGSGVRVNALSPGGVFNGQDEAFVKKLSNLIPMGRMANAGEYKAAVIFLVSDASSYMTGANVVMDGGRSVW